MKRILISLLTVGSLGAVVFGVTQAFFSDTETSVGNTFQAGDIDLQIDNESYAIDYNIPEFPNPVGAFVASTTTSWLLVDLTVQKFFDFIDLKPGDYGEDTISIHVGSNSAWLCAAARVTDDSDQSCTEPELADDPQCTDPGLGDGELDSEVNFAFWADDGDNVYEPVAGVNGGVAETIFVGGQISDLDSQGQIALADADNSIWPGGGPVPGGETVYVAKAWCFGDMVSTDLEQDGTDTQTPLDPRGTGFDCIGDDVDNAAQTDMVVADLQFYAVQSRNNSTFSCETDFIPDWPSQEL